MQNDAQTYFRVYDWMVSRLGLRGGELLVYAYLYSHTTKQVSQGAIARAVGMKNRAVTYVLRKLQANKLVELTSENSGTAYKFDIQTPANFAPPTPAKIAQEPMQILHPNNNNIINTHTLKEKEKEKDVFTPPTWEDVVAFAKTKNYTPYAKQFYTYYLSNDWTRSNGQPIRNWRAALAYWALSEMKKKKPASPAGQNAGADADGRRRIRNMIQDICHAQNPKMY